MRAHTRTTRQAGTHIVGSHMEEARRPIDDRKMAETDYMDRPKPRTEKLHFHICIRVLLVRRSATPATPSASPATASSTAASAE